MSTTTIRSAEADATPRATPRRPASSYRTDKTKRAKQPEVVRTWAFDSKGTRKYAIQIKRARNGNPCLKLVEGVPNEDGTFRRFHLTIWSEDFDQLFATLDEVRTYMQEHDIRTPEGHSYDPSKRSSRRGRACGTGS